MLTRNLTVCATGYVRPARPAPPHRLRALALALTLLPLSAVDAAPGPASTRGMAAASSVLAEADALFVAGDMQGVYALLAPREFEFAGLPRFDLMFGFAALETGNPSLASLAFERVLALEPHNQEARLHLARAYLALNDRDGARREFDTLLAADPTQSVRTTVGQYLEALRASQPDTDLQMTGYLETSGGYDSNVTGSTAQNVIAIPIDPNQLQLPDSAVQAGAAYLTLDAGGTLFYRLGETLAAYAGADVLTRRNTEIEGLDYVYTTGRAGLSRQFGNQTLRGGASASNFALDGDTFRQSAGIDAELRRTFAARTQGSLGVGFTAYRHDPDTAVIEDYNQATLLLSASRLLGADGQHLMSLAADFGHEDDLNGRADGNRFHYGLRAAGQARLTERLNAYATLGYQASDYAARNAIFLTEREEHQWNSAVGLNFTISRGFVVRPSVTWLDQDSNIPLYEYSRWSASLSLHVDFL